MSVYNRPAAFGAILNGSNITVTFPDDATYTGRLRLPNTIAWSNGSAWTKDSPTIKTVIDLNGRWASGGTPGPVILATSTSFTINMSAYNRPAAQGVIVDGSTIAVTFPDDALYTGKLQSPNTIVWSNGSAWTKA
jgi:hypothetical protein